MLSRSDGVTALPASATVSVDGSRALGVTGDGDNQPAAQVRQTSFNLEPNQVKTRANTAQGETAPSGVGGACFTHWDTAAGPSAAFVVLLLFLLRLLLLPH